MTLQQLTAKRNEILDLARWYHEQGCFSGYTHYMEEARKMEGEIEKMKRENETKELHDH